MKHTLYGTTMQTVTFELEPGEQVYTESGGMAWMSANIEMETNMEGGILSGLKRSMAGESMFMTTFTCGAGNGIITFASEFPGKIIHLNLQPGQSVICQKSAFMCASRTVQLEMHFRQKLGAGFFGGEGFIMQKVTGPGDAFFEIAGEVTEYELQAGQVLKVDTGHVAMMEPTVAFDITRVKGFKNVMFGGEGLFLASVAGPGKVWLQSMPIANLAAKISPFIATGS